MCPVPSTMSSWPTTSAGCPTPITTSSPPPPTASRTPDQRPGSAATHPPQAATSHFHPTSFRYHARERRLGVLGATEYARAVLNKSPNRAAGSVRRLVIEATYPL